MEKKVLLPELAERLAARCSISKRSAESFLRAFFMLAEQNLLNDRYVKIKDIGVFKIVDVSERESVNVATGERIQIEGHCKINFTAEGKLRDLVNMPFAHFSSVELADDVNFEEMPLPPAPPSVPLTAEEVAEEPRQLAPLSEESKAGNTERDESVPASPAPLEEESGENQSVAQSLVQLLQSEQGQKLSPQEIMAALQQMMDASATQAPSAPAGQSLPDAEEHRHTEEAASGHKDVAGRRRSGRVAGHREKWERRRVAQLSAPTVPAIPSEQPSAPCTPCEDTALREETPVCPKPEEATCSEETGAEGKCCLLRKWKGFRFVWLILLAGLLAWGGYHLFSKLGDAEVAVADTLAVDEAPVSKVNVKAVMVDSVIEQIPDAAYEIMGTWEEHALREGESLSKISKRVFGTPYMTRYIAFYNHIANADTITVGTLVKVPVLKRRATGEIINGSGSETSPASTNTTADGPQ